MRNPSGFAIRKIHSPSTWTAIILPVTTLIYGLREIRAGVNYFHLETLPAAVFALLFATVTILLIGPIGAGNRRSIRAAAVIYSFFEYAFLFAGIIFLGFALTALTKVFGINYFVADLNNPVLTTFHSGILSALSAIAWRVTHHSAMLLNRALKS